jgi:hypothetical protein
MRALALLALSSTLAVAAPPPDQASGVETEDATPLSDLLLVVPRTLLYVPRGAVWLVGQPLRGAAYAYDKYDIRGVFFNDAGTFGIYPVANYESGYGLTGGARLVHYDVFGAGERIKLRTDIGGRFRQAYGVNLRTGQRFAPVGIEIDSSYERRPTEKFYGVGNGDGMLQEFHEDVVRNVLAVDVRPYGDFHLRTSGALMLRELDDTRPMGFAEQTQNLYVEQEVAYDSRRPASIYASEALDGTGWLLSLHAGVTRGIGDDRSAYTTVGGEVQRYFDLYEGTRTLALRVLAEGVVGKDERIPLIDLPRLGGSEYLRGYPSGRFRDRAIALGTIEYAWDLGNYLGGYAFVDAGRTFHDDVDDAELRIGYGGGIQVHTMASYVSRIQVAASRDGDVTLQLSFSPALGRRERAGRF